MSDNQKFDDELKKLTDYRHEGKRCENCCNAAETDASPDPNALHCERLDIFVLAISVCTEWDKP